MPRPAPVQDSVASFGHEELHFMGHGHLVWPAKVYMVLFKLLIC
jgi:hypothetical protein